LPRVIRDALRVWQYDQATELLDGAAGALDARDEVQAAAKAVGLTAPTTMRTAFESPRGFAAAVAEADAELSAIDAYRAAAATAPTEPEPLQRIGLWNSEPEVALDEAAAAFAAGDLEGTVRAASFAQRTWESAPEIGRNRVLAVGASLAALLLATWLVFRWLRDRGNRRRSVVAMRVGKG
jgi:hypothetical protein